MKTFSSRRYVGNGIRRFRYLTVKQIPISPTQTPSKRESLDPGVSKHCGSCVKSQFMLAFTPAVCGKVTQPPVDDRGVPLGYSLFVRVKYS